VALFSSIVSHSLEHKGASVGADAQFAKPDLQLLSQKLLELISRNKEN
jgi:two-component system chemotaxis response regulator CheV